MDQKVKAIKKSQITLFHQLIEKNILTNRLNLSSKNITANVKVEWSFDSKLTTFATFKDK